MDGLIGFGKTCHLCTKMNIKYLLNYSKRNISKAVGLQFAQIRVVFRGGQEGAFAP